MKKKILLSVLLFLVLSEFQAIAQLPVVTVRFANPQFYFPTATYCLDVEFISDTPGIQLFGMNVRFFYDDNILEFLSMGDFQQGYASTDPPQILTGPSGSGNLYGITGPLEWLNGKVDLVDISSIYLSTNAWTKLFTICFHVDDPASLFIYNFCPSIIWDLQLYPENGGFLPGDDGVVITVVDPTYDQDSWVTTENVVQFNWEYDLSGNEFGYPQGIICIATRFINVPLLNWSLFLTIGLMLGASIFIYRRRI